MICFCSFACARVRERGMSHQSRLMEDVSNAIVTVSTPPDVELYNRRVLWGKVYQLPDLFYTSSIFAKVRVTPLNPKLIAGYMDVYASGALYGIEGYKDVVLAAHRYRVCFMLELGLHSRETDGHEIRVLQFGIIAEFNPRSDPGRQFMRLEFQRFLMFQDWDIFEKKMTPFCPVFFDVEVILGFLLGIRDEFTSDLFFNLGRVLWDKVYQLPNLFYPSSILAKVRATALNPELV
ncbi:hypothetical protein IGI04_039919 [Brassica rapa subsp. trilocularis]|uniref:Uncharacterized protein n=1 Tax=Brassica rapa subsp. trilocularis TaxID=1813537 RepID=A0ABQ7KLA4_BRACM|nr:hypothetical protein IGI04_039919 [Brassica rapa subsp. trilocularis]